MERTKNKHDEDMIAQFGEMVHAVERAADELARPWKVSVALLTVALLAVILWRKR